jgi:hypothetical protein
MPYRMIDEMPSIGEVEDAEQYQIVAWHLFLRPTLMNEELSVVKAIAQRYDRMSAVEREAHAARARRDRTL